MAFWVAAMALTSSQSGRAAVKVTEEKAAAPAAVKSNAQEVAEEKTAAPAAVNSNAQEVAEEKAAAPAKVKSIGLNGTIEATDLKASTITIKHKEERKTFTVARDCEVTGAGNKKVTLADLVIGERVKVKYTQEGDQLVAHQISHVEKKKKAKEAPPAK